MLPTERSTSEPEEAAAMWDRMQMGTRPFNAADVAAREAVKGVPGHERRLAYIRAYRHATGGA